MDYSNERYVRLYTRDGDDWVALSWQAKALYPLMRRKADRAGLLETRRGEKGIAGLVTMPIEVVIAGLPDLLEYGWVQEYPGGYVICDFIEGEEASQSDRFRARESRLRRRERAHDSVTTTHETKHSVTNRDAQDVDSRDDASRTVTPASLRAVPDRAVPDRADAAGSNGQAGLLAAIGEISPTKRAGVAALLRSYAEGYSLPAGTGIPTAEQLDQACDEVRATVDLGNLNGKTLAKFVAATVRGESTGARSSDPRSVRAIDLVRAQHAAKRSAS